MQGKDCENLCHKSEISQKFSKEFPTPKNIFLKARTFFSPSTWRQNSCKNSQDEILNKPLNFKDHEENQIKLKNHDNLQKTDIIQHTFLNKIENEKSEDKHIPPESPPFRILQEDNLNKLPIDLETQKLNERDIPSKIFTPNEILSSFFSQKGNSPLNTVEIQGVISLMSKNTTSNIDFSPFVTPLKMPQQSTLPVHNQISTPTSESFIKFGSSVPTFSRLKKHHTFGPTISTPFRKRKSTQRSSFHINDGSRPFLSSKYDLLTTIEINENKDSKSGDKRGLDITLAPEAKRCHVDATFFLENSSKDLLPYTLEASCDTNSKNLIKPAKSRTVTNILNILDKEENKDSVKKTPDIQSVLNPYASPSTHRRTVSSKHGSSPLNQKKKKSVAEEIEESMYFNTPFNHLDKKSFQNSETIYKKYKPVISSNLQNIIPVKTNNEDTIEDNSIDINNSKKPALNILSSRQSISQDLATKRVDSGNKDFIFQTFKDNQQTSDSISTLKGLFKSKINNQPLTLSSNDYNKSAIHTPLDFLSQNESIFNSSEKIKDQNTSIVACTLNQKSDLTEGTFKTDNKSPKHEIYRIDPNLLPRFSFTILPFKKVENKIRNALLVPETQLHKYTFSAPMHLI